MPTEPAIDLKKLEKTVKKAQEHARKLASQAAVKDPKKKQRAATIQSLAAAARLDEL